MRTVRRIAILIGLALVTFGSVQLSHVFRIGVDGPPPVWASLPIALAAVLLWGRWTALATGPAIFAALVVRGTPGWMALAVAAVVLGEALVTVGVLRRFREFHIALDRLQDLIALIAVSSATALLGGALLVPVVHATMPVHGTFFTDLDEQWWGQLCGILAIAPLVLTWSTRPLHSDQPAHFPGEALLLAVAILTLGWLVFTWTPAEHWPAWRRPFTVLPLMMWAALRFGPRGASAANLAVATLAIAGLETGGGAFRDIAQAQWFVAISSLTTLALAAIALERTRAERRKSAILQCAPDAIVTIDDHGTIVELNPAAEQLLGPAGRLAGHELPPDAIPPLLDEAHRTDSHDVDGAGGLVASGMRFVARRANGESFPAELSVARTPFEDRVLVTGFVHDITTEQRAERVLLDARSQLEQRVRERTGELARSSELLREAEALAHLGSWELDLQNGSVKWSDELYRIYGQDPASFVPTLERFEASIHPDDRQRWHAEMARRLSEPTVRQIEMRIQRPDGAIRWIRAQAHVSRVDGRPVRLIGCSQDITEERLGEETRRKLAGLVDHADDAIIGLNAEGTIETWNAAACRTFGYRDSDVIGRQATMLLSEPGGEELRHILDTVRDGREPQHYELVHRRKDGTEFPAQVTVAAVSRDTGAVIGFAKVVRDISQQKQIEAQLRASLDEKEVLLREIHHRVKNNLQVISSLLHLQLGAAADPRTVEPLVESQNRIQSMALVHQLLYQSKDLARIDLGDYVRELAKRLIAAYHVAPDRITVTVDADPARLDADRAITCGLLVNELITNALVHAFPGGRSGHVWITISHAAGELTLAVRDDGVGLPEALRLETVTTFGLRIAQALAKQLDGTLELVRDHGTAVRVVIAP